MRLTISGTILVTVKRLEGIYDEPQGSQSNTMLLPALRLITSRAMLSVYIYTSENINASNIKQYAIHETYPSFGRRQIGHSIN